jgi:PAS domain S-box-containing protein
VSNMPESGPIRILYMEDDPGLGRLFQRRLGRAGYVVDVAPNGKDGVAMYDQGSYDVIAVDQTMPIHSGLEVIRILASRGSLPPTIMVTGTGSEQIAVEAMKLGASDYVVKDVDGGYLDLLLPVIERVLQQQRLLAEKQRAESALRRRAAELEALTQVSSALGTAQTVDEILSIILEETTRLIVTAFCSIYLVESGTGALVGQATSPSGHYPLGERHRPGQGLVGRVATTGEVYISEDLGRDPLIDGQGGDPKLTSAEGGCIALPLRTQERNVGVMSVVLQEPRPFASEEAQLLTAIANIAANALYRALAMQGLEAEVAARTAEIRAEREKSDAILRSVGDAIIMTNLEGEIEYVNAAFTALTGYTAAEVMGRQGDSLLEREATERIWETLYLASDRQEMLQEEVTVRRKDGRTYDAALTVAPMYDADGRLVGYVSSHRDISRLKDLDRARNRFMSNISHELRTPATTLNAAIYLLRKGSSPEKTEIYLDMMGESTDRLIHLIEDILDMTALDSGRAVDVWQSVSLEAIVGVIVDRYRRRAEEVGVALVALPAPVDLPVVEGDHGRLVQALGEVVENAVTFTPPGGRVTVRIEIISRDERRWVTIAVQDTGPGLLPEEQERMFDRFFRGRLAESGSIPGTGLGLSIAYEIMRAHGGRLTVESAVESGSTFTLWLLPVGTYSQTSMKR